MAAPQPAEKDFTTDLARGKVCERLVRDLLDATFTSSSKAERHTGDMTVPWLDGLHVEVKCDFKFDKTGNIAVELADLDTKTGRTLLTGVFKHYASGRNTVLVHSLGGAMEEFLVYRADMVVGFLYWAGGVPQHYKGWSLRSWWNGATSGAFRTTAGLVIPVRSRAILRTKRHPLPPAFRLATKDTLREAVADAHGTHTGGFEVTDLYRQLGSQFPCADVTACLDDIAVKGLPTRR